MNCQCVRFLHQEEALSRTKSAHVPALLLQVEPGTASAQLVSTKLVWF